MNILHVIASMDPAQGGVSQGLRNTLPELERLGVYNEVVSLDSGDALYLKNDSFKTHALNGKGPWKYSRKLVPWLLDNLGRFDAVIIHALWLYPSYATNRALVKYGSKSASNARKSRIRLFVMPHGMLDPYFQRADGRKLKAVRNWIYWKIFESKVINTADGILFTCETELLLAREPFRPYNPAREINVGLGIETPPHYSASMRLAFLEKCPAARGQEYILFLSRIHPKKGIDLLISAYLNIAMKSKRRLPKLVIAGPGIETAYGKKLVHMVQTTLTLSETILFTGMLAGDAKWGAFYEAQAFILPSHQENFGIAVVEALACSKPVLISNQVNIWREIEKAGGGIIRPNTPEGIESLLNKWTSLTTDEKQQMGGSARLVFEKEFAISTTAKRFLEATTSNSHF